MSSLTSNPTDGFADTCVITIPSHTLIRFVKPAVIRNGNKPAANRIRKEFIAENAGDWMYRQVKKWAKEFAKDTAYLHIFRKTSLQFARRGEDLNRIVASDASLTTAVMMASYAEEADDEMRHKSNRTYRRILASLPVDVATRYGYEEKTSGRLIEQLDTARSTENWSQVVQVAGALQALVDAGDESDRMTA
ncbi:MAG: hypothetical protein P1U77_23215 [Rubripirellula sp.]|nr:hypothetical protein [Rubripirellula sp.]